MPKGQANKGSAITKLIISMRLPARSTQPAQGNYCKFSKNKSNGAAKLLISLNPTNTNP